MRINRKQILVIVSILLSVWAVLLAACSSPGVSAAPPLATPAAVPQPAPSVFKTTNLVINPAEVNTEVGVLITANVTNTGAEDGRYIGDLRIDNATRASLPYFLYSKEVVIPAGASQVVSVTTSVGFPGTYKVSWGDLTRELVVKYPEETEQPGLANAAPQTSMAPDFRGVDVVTGKTVTLSQYAGSAVLLNFVNYGCDPFLNQKVGNQLFAIRDLAKQRNDFVPISVFCGCCPPETLRKFARDNGFNWPWVLDTDNSIVARYTSYLRKYGYPTLIFINGKQVINEVTGSVNPATLNEKINNISPAAAK